MANMKAAPPCCGGRTDAIGVIASARGELGTRGLYELTNIPKGKYGRGHLYLGGGSAPNAARSPGRASQS